MFGWFKGKKEEIIEPVQEPEQQERRGTDRADTYADVVAKSNSGRFLKKGIALDLSANGARLRFENGDSLLDGVESNTGTWVGIGDTGTNPVLPDSDGGGR